MEFAGPPRRVLLGPDRPRPPARSRRWATIWVYAAPLGLLALAGLALANASYLVENREMGHVLAGALSAWTVLPVALAVHRPLLAWRLAYPLLFLGAFSAASTRESWPWSPVQIFSFLAVLSVLARREESAVLAWVTGLTMVPLFVFAPRANAWGAALLLVAIALAGDLVSRRRRSREELARQAELTELEQARRAVLEERARIAREMHDVVAHHMSMIAVQAETASFRITGLPPPALAEFTTIAAGAREALTDMRRLLGVLRAETDESPRAPQPGLAEVTALVETARRAGVEVEFVAAEVAEVPEGVGLAAYRIVQEALANAARHAPGIPVLVSVRGAAGALWVEVSNGPGLPAAAPGDPRAATGRHGSSTGRHGSLTGRHGSLTGKAWEAGTADDSRGGSGTTDDTPSRSGTTDDSPGESGMGDDTPGGSGTASGGPGHGLIGMRERSALLGGTLSAGPEPGGGYRVAARLPLPPRPATPSPSPPATPTPSPTPSPTPTPTPTTSPTPTPTPTPTPCAPPTPSPSAVATPITSPPAVPLPSPSAIPTPTPVPLPSPSVTPSQSPTVEGR